jgi:hypothetical protein
LCPTISAIANPSTTSRGRKMRPASTIIDTPSTQITWSMPTKDGRG